MWLKIGRHGILKALILNADLGFWNSDPKIGLDLDPFLGKFGPKKSPENWHTWYLEDVHSYFNISFSQFPTKHQFLGKCGPKNSKLSVLPENGHKWYLDDVHSYSDKMKKGCKCWGNSNKVSNESKKNRFLVFFIPFGHFPQSNNFNRF